MIKRPKILFIYQYKSSFIQKDLELLRKHFDVREMNFVLNWRNLKGTLMISFRMLIGVLCTDVTFSWFADSHAYVAVRLSKLFKKKSIVIVGGYEVAKLPEIGYGMMLYPNSTRMVKYVLDNADKVLTVDDGLRKDAINNCGISGKNIQTVPTGYDYETFKPKGEKENLVITVSVGDNWGRARLKGLDTFVKSAKLLDAKFLVIGIQGDALKGLQDIASSNVEFINQASQEVLISYYQKAKVYCQLSMREGLPNALCEAMLCECVPVGTNIQGVQTAIGDTGFYVPYGDPEATAEAIKKALQSDKGKEPRVRIIKNFSMQIREKELLSILKNYE